MPFRNCGSNVQHKQSLARALQVHLGALECCVNSDMAALLDFDFGDEEAEVSASDSDSEASSEDEDEEEDEEDSDSSTRKASKKKPKAVPKKAGKKAKAKPVARVKKDKTKKKKKKDKGRTLKADRSSVTRQSNKGDDQLMRFKNWRSVADACFHICFFCGCRSDSNLSTVCAGFLWFLRLPWHFHVFFPCLRSATSRIS